MRLPLSVNGIFLICLLSLLALFACHKEKRKSFEIAEGPAAATLKTFASQAEIEILFDPKQVEGFRTQAVMGNFSPEQTLELMLSQTSLKYSIDPKTHAYAIFHPQTSLPPGHQPTPE